MEAVHCKIKLANNRFILVNIVAYNNFMWTRKGVIVNVVIWIIETYDSLLKSHLAAQICTFSYVEYFLNSYKIIFGFNIILQLLHHEYIVQVLQNFQNTAVFKTVFKNTLYQ